MVKLFPSAPVYALATVYIPTTQVRLPFLSALSGLYNLQMEVAALVYMPKSCIYIPEPSSGNHYTLLPLAGDKNICIGALSTFTVAKLTVASKYSSSNMGVHLKLPPSFGPQLDSVDLLNKPALHRGSIWKNANLVVRGEDRRLLLVDGEPVAMESPIKVASVDQFTPLQCTALTNVGYEPKFANDVFAFRETVAEMRQLLDRGKTEATKKEPPEPKITEDCHQEALAATQAPMFVSKSSDIQVVLPSGAEAVDPVKYRVFLGVTENQGEEAATASTGISAQSPQGTAATKAMPIPANTATDKDDANPRCSPACLCEVLGEMNNSLEHLETGYFNCFNKTVTATREVLAEVNEIDATYVDAVLEAMTKWQATVSFAIMDMHTDDCIVWDAKRDTLDKATQIFGEACEANCIKCANAREARRKAVVEGDEKNPIVKLLDWVLVKTREAANLAVAAFQKQFEEALVPRMPAEHLPVLVSCAYSTMSQFRMAIWRMVPDE